MDGGMVTYGILVSSIVMGLHPYFRMEQLWDTWAGACLDVRMWN